jgi:uncharacterized protein YjbK
MEQELKIRLTGRDDYERLERRLGPALRGLEQLNAYLDTPALELRARRIMARIRQLADGEPLRMTVKWGATRQDGYFQAEEVERDLQAVTPELAIASGEAARTLHELCPEARGLDLGGLRLLGCLRNRRKLYVLDGFELELDHSTYPDGAEDYELELETAEREAAVQRVTLLLQEAGARGEPQTLTKFERFLSHLEPSGTGPAATQVRHASSSGRT